jgi:hypothetical protein
MSNLSSGDFNIFDYLKDKNTLVNVKYKISDQLKEVVGYLLSYDPISNKIVIKELNTSQYVFIPLQNIEQLNPVL